MPVDLVLAHQGGWDESLFVALPLLLFYVLLQIAKRRADREVKDEDRPPE
ncbi:MAG: hypothetical protein JF603_15565 [Acidobacteria bacterium]|nr:hypothetical protein [Acidobacteriota bacterium]